jgi:small subunit ribosomal protein S6
MKTNTYEIMFLVDGGAPSFEVACEPILAMLSRAKGEVLSIKPWDERKLCYAIKGRTRGLYVLTYVKMDAQNVLAFERDCQLNEQILRILVMRKDKLTQEQIDAETPSTAAAAQAQVAEAAATVAAEEAAAAEAAATAEAAEAPVEAPAEAPVEAPAEAPAEEPQA